MVLSWVSLNQETLPSKEKFRPAIWAWAISLLLALGLVVLRALLSPELSPEQTGSIIGEIIGMGIIAILLSWITFRIAGRSNYAGSVVLVSVVLLSVSTRVSNLGAEKKREQSQYTQDLTRRLEAADTETERTALLAEVASASGLGDAAPGLVELVNEIRRKTDEASSRYEKAMESVASERFLDLEAMLVRDEYTWQHGVVTEYDASAIAYRSALEGATTQLEQGIKTLQLEDEFAKGMRGGYEKKLAPVLAYLQGNGELMSSYGQVIALLEAEHGQWQLDNDVAPVFDSSLAQEQFHALFETIAKQEEAVNSLE